MRNLVLKFGIIAGSILVLMMATTIPMLGNGIAFKWGEVIGYSTMIVALSTVFFGIKSYRDQHQEGIITFGKAFKVGILITLIASAMYVIGWMIISNTLASDFSEQYYEYFIENLKNSGKAPEVIEQQMERYNQSQELYENPLVKLGVSFLEIFPVGLIVDVICAAILRKKK